MPRFAHLQNGSKVDYCINLLGGLGERMHIKSGRSAKHRDVMTLVAIIMFTASESLKPILLRSNRVRWKGLWGSTLGSAAQRPLCPDVPCVWSAP